MRIATSQVFLNNINSLSEANSALFKTQQQIATGKKVLQPSDDPLAAAQIIKLKKEVARNDQFQGNIEVSNRRLALEEITLNQLFNEGVRLKELTIQAGDGILSQANQASLATEVDEILQQMLGLVNTKDVQGEYLFSGFKGETRSYEYDELTQRYAYQGDSGQRYIQIGPDTKVASTDAGTRLFEQVPGVVMPSMAANTAVRDIHVRDFKALEQADAAGTSPYSMTLTDTGEFSVQDSLGNPVPVFTGEDPTEGSPSMTVASGDRVRFGGVEVVIGDLPAAGAPADVVTVETETQRDNILNVALELRNGLQNVDYTTDEGKAVLDQLLGKTLTALEGVQDTNIRARGSIGARMNALEQQEMVNEDYQLFTKGALSSFEDLEYNEALSQFALQQATLQAAYSSFSQISGLSLFNYIK
ncbi:flagellar hook-associated protein FlgL [Marinobacterium marinum]|uniref:Flagellar hook-associated protein FlgL n=1 Tax=Marinobacterium marinum TaxID=2756129 RepID=A0A7W1WVF6_9GAMM|nr:flagellar hook-associated protein FlgL [Marinobacterium marinum]MBA4500912.1 flagellar hook-associated protein FlgL [Marinobacterium marinum]